MQVFMSILGNGNLYMLLVYSHFGRHLAIFCKVENAHTLISVLKHQLYAIGCQLSKYSYTTHGLPIILPQKCKLTTFSKEILIGHMYKDVLCNILYHSGKLIETKCPLLG